MQYHFIRLFIFHLLFIAADGETLNIMETVKDPDCAFTSSLLEYCVAEFTECKTQKATFQICNSQLLGCTKESLPDNKQKCDIYIKNTISTVRKFESQFYRKFSFEWSDDIGSVVAKIEKECGLEIRNDNLSALRKLQELLQTNECVSKYKKELAEAAIEKDEMTSKTLPIPFERSRCGWQFGYIGILFFRHWISTECGSNAINLNHCCAEHLNCYVDQNEKETCDELFSSCQNGVVNRMIKLKGSCQSLVKRLSQENVYEMKDYEAIKQSKIKTEIGMFGGDFSAALTMKDTQMLNFTKIKVFRLRFDDSVDSEVRETFNKNAYKNGWPKRVIIDSCALMFEECRGQEMKNVCLRRFEICLQSIDGRTEDFARFLSQFGLVVTSQLQNILTKKDFEKFKEENAPSRIYQLCETVSVIYCVLSFGYFLFKQVQNRLACFGCKTISASQIISPSDIPLENIRSEQSQPLNEIVHDQNDGGTIQSGYVNQPSPSN